MAQLAPINFGPPVENDSRYDAGQAREAIGQRGEQTQHAEQVAGETGKEGGSELQQTIVTNQATTATLASREFEANAIKFVESNPTVKVGVLAGMMSPGALKNAINQAQVSTPGVKDTNPDDVVQMHDIAGTLYDDQMKQADQDIAKQITLPGWRSKWLTASASEHENTHSERINKIAAAQMVQWVAKTGLDNFNQSLDASQKSGDFSLTRQLLETTSTIKNDPIQYHKLTHDVDVAQDTFADRQAVREGPTSANLAKLNDSIATLRTSAGAQAAYKGMTQDELDSHRAALEQITKSWGGGIQAQKDLPGMIAPNGKVDPAKLLKATSDSTDPKYITELNRRASENNKLVEEQNADMANSLMTAGSLKTVTNKDGSTKQVKVPFSMAQLHKTPGADDMLVELTKRDPKLAEALDKEDQSGVRFQMTLERAQNAIDASNTRAEKAEAKAALAERVGKSKDARSDIGIDMDDNPEVYKDMSGTGFNAKLLHEYPGILTPEDRLFLNDRFERRQKEWAKPEQAAHITIKNEVAKLGLDPNAEKVLRSDITDKEVGWENQWKAQHQGKPPGYQDLIDYIKSEVTPGSVTHTGVVARDKMRRSDYEDKLASGELTADNQFEPENSVDINKQIEPPLEELQRAPQRAPTNSTGGTSTINTPKGLKLVPTNDLDKWLKVKGVTLAR